MTDKDQTAATATKATKATKATTAVKEKKGSLSEAEKFLESLDLPDTQNQESDANMAGTDTNDIMSFLDEISNYPVEDNQIDAATSNEKDGQSKQTELSKENKPVASSEASNDQQQQPSNTDSSWSSWGNNFWSQASAAVKTNIDQINKTVGTDTTKLLESRVQALQSLVNKENIEKLGTGLKNLTTSLLETVAPPISEHELVEVWLSYDMVGYNGTDALVYRAFARVMENTESGQVVVHNPDTEDKKSTSATDDPSYRELNMCDSAVDGTKLAKANLDHLIKQHYKPDSNTKKEAYNPQSGAVPVIHCPVFMAIQPVKISVSPIDKEDMETHQLSFVILLVDPTHKLNFKTYSQTMPLGWLNIPYEENEWVEEKMVDMIRMAVTSIAQDYVWTRMSGTNNTSEDQPTDSTTIVEQENKMQET